MLYWTELVGVIRQWFLPMPSIGSPKDYEIRSRRQRQSPTLTKETNMTQPIPLSSQDITQADIAAVLEVMQSSHLSLGPRVPQFEANFAEYIGRKRAVAVNSGTSALHLCMLAAGIGPGDEVITTPFSFISTTNCILMVGATPVFVDIDPTHYNITPQAVAAKITDKTKAVLPVEVFGNPTGIDAIHDLCTEKGLICIEDSCEALGSIVNDRKAGTLGLASTFAFYPNKQMTTGEGGIILTDDDAFADRCCSLRNQGRDPDGGWLAHARLGYNYRLSDINCALGITQLERIETFVANARPWPNATARYWPMRIVSSRRPNRPTAV